MRVLFWKRGLGVKKYWGVHFSKDGAHIITGNGSEHQREGFKVHIIGQRYSGIKKKSQKWGNITKKGANLESW